MPHRVIVWGTGNVGVPALRIVIANPALELAGVIVSNPAKVGKDAGELCGLPATGVRATADVAAALAAGADAVAYCASGDFRPTDALDDVERCLRAQAAVTAAPWPRDLCPQATRSGAGPRSGCGSTRYLSDGGTHQRPVLESRPAPACRLIGRANVAVICLPTSSAE